MHVNHVYISISQRNFWNLKFSLRIYIKQKKKTIIIIM